MQGDTGTKMTILGKGSVRNKAKVMLYEISTVIEAS